MVEFRGFMRHSPIIFCILWISLVGDCVLAQPQRDRVPELAFARFETLRTEILKDLEKFPPREKAIGLSDLGAAHRELDNVEALRLQTMAVELLLAPTTHYDDNLERLKFYARALYRTAPAHKPLRVKLVSKIREIQIHPGNNPQLEQANNEYAYIARSLLQHDSDAKIAYEFLKLSLRGDSPYFSSFLSGMTMNVLLAADPELFGRYYDDLLASRLTLGRRLPSDFFDQVVKLVADERPKGEPYYLSLTESQKKRFLLAFLEIVTKRRDSLKRADELTCYWTIRLGIDHGDVFRRVLPERTADIDAALALCENSTLPPWKKPSFAKRPASTSRDLLDRADEISDKAEKSRYLIRAANAAQAERNYRLATEILGKVEPSFPSLSSKFSRVFGAAEEVGALLSERKVAEATAVLDSFPPELQPYVILEAFLRTRSLLKAKNGPDLKSFADRARAGFAGFKEFPNDSYFNPTQFAALQQVYLELGFESDALAVNAEAVASFNRLTGNISAKLKDKAANPGMGYFARPSRNSWSMTQMDFVYKNFDRIRQNIALIEDDRKRLFERQLMMRDLFWDNREAFLKRAAARTVK